MKKIWQILFIFLIFITPAFATEKLTVLLDWFLNPAHAPLFIAQTHGFFKQQNLDVKLIGPSDPSDPPKMVAAGKVDIGIDYQPEFLQQVDQGLPLVIIGSLINHPLNCLVTLNNISNLRGKTIGYSGSGINQVSLKIILEHMGLKLSDVNAVNIHFDLTQALLSKKVDAVTGIMRTYEIKQIELAGGKVNVFYPENYGIPTYNELIFIVNTKNKNDDRYRRFLIAVKNATAYLRAHPNETWNEFAKAHPESSDEVNRSSWFNTLTYFANDPYIINQKEFMDFAKFMQKNALIKTVRPFNDYVKVES